MESTRTDTVLEVRRVPSKGIRASCLFEERYWQIDVWSEPHAWGSPSVMTWERVLCCAKRACESTISLH